MEKLEQLWHLQQHDLSIFSLEKDLEKEPLIKEVQKLQARYDKEKSIIEEIKKDLYEKKKENKSLDISLQKAVDEIKYLKKQLYGGEVSNLKELSSMEKKLELVEKDEENLENKIIEQIEAVEEAEKAHNDREKIAKVCEKKLKTKKDELKKKTDAIKAEIINLKNEREELIKNIEKRYLAKYNALIKRADKRGVAKVIENICEGCHVSISNAQQGKLYNPDILLYCENCGRLLVKFREDIENEKNKKKESNN